MELIALFLFRFFLLEGPPSPLFLRKVFQTLDLRVDFGL